MQLVACAFDPGSGGGTGSGVGGSSTGAADSTSAIAVTTTSGVDDNTTSTSTGGSDEATGATSDTTAAAIASSTGTVEDTTTGPVLPSCPDVLWVWDEGAPEQGDLDMIDRLESVGFHVVKVQDNLVMGSDAAGYCVVIVSSAVSSTDVGTKFRNVDPPVIVMEYNLFDDMGFATGTGFGLVDQDDIVIVDPDSPLAAGYTGTVPVFASEGQIAWATAPGAHTIAARTDDLAQSVLFEYAPGSVLADGGVTESLRLGLPFLDPPMPMLLPAALDLFEAAVWYATEA